VLHPRNYLLCVSVGRPPAGNTPRARRRPPPRRPRPPPPPPQRCPAPAPTTLAGLSRVATPRTPSPPPPPRDAPPRRHTLPPALPYQPLAGQDAQPLKNLQLLPLPEW